MGKNRDHNLEKNLSPLISVANYINYDEAYPASAPENNTAREETEYISLYSSTPDAFKWHQLTWDDNFQNFDHDKYDADGKGDGDELLPFRYMELPPGGVHVPLGPNQWLMDEAHSDNPFICKPELKI